MTIEKQKKQKKLFIVGIVFLITLLIGASFAYFQIMSSADYTSTVLIGEGEHIGQPTLTTGVTSLQLNITEGMMNDQNVGNSFYATPSGTAVEASEVTDNNGRYILATAGVTEGTAMFDCSYAYDISASATKTITDGSDEQIKIVITEPSGESTTYTLKQLYSGVTHSGNLKFINPDQNIKIEAYITNTLEYQDDLIENNFTITIDPSTTTEHFSCDISEDWLDDAYGKPIAPYLASNYKVIEGLWSSGLEGDGLRYVGSGAYNGDATPSNFICFGTTSASECKANEEKYMYRIIGVFPDENGTQHLKLRKFKQLGTKTWNDTTADVNWGESTLYTELNGSYFLGNTTYSYLQDDIWSNKIENWKWTAVNTKTYDGSNGPNYYSGSTMTPANIYLHEMNRSTKTSTVGEWTYPTGKIGLIYASDYVLSLGNEALTITGSTSNNSEKLKTGWLHYTNNLAYSSSAFDWTLARIGAIGSAFYAWHVVSSGDVSFDYVTSTNGVAPVFYLTSDTTISGGMGTYSEPYIIDIN